MSPEPSASPTRPQALPQAGPLLDRRARMLLAALAAVLAVVLFALRGGL